MFYAIHDQHGDLTGNQGQIVQAIKIFVGGDEQAAYEQRLRDDGHAFEKEQRAGLLPPERFFVNSGITERPRMNCLAHAPIVKPGAAAVITGIPKGAAVDVLCADMNVWSIAALDGDELQFTMPDYPCTYRAVIRKWPYQDCSIDIQGVQS